MPCLLCIMLKWTWMGVVYRYLYFSPISLPLSQLNFPPKFVCCHSASSISPHSPSSSHAKHILTPSLIWSCSCQHAHNLNVASGYFSVSLLHLPTSNPLSEALSSGFDDSSVSWIPSYLTSLSQSPMPCMNNNSQTVGYIRIVCFVKKKKKKTTGPRPRHSESEWVVRVPMPHRVLNKWHKWEFPGGPVVRTARFHCWGHGSGN